MFSAFTDYLLDNGYVVICSIYNYEKNVLEFSIVYNKVERDKARGSKYFQSETKNIYSDAINYLKSNEDNKIVFVGTGCQTQAFRKYMTMFGMSERVILIDINCHGVPSKKYVFRYIKYITNGDGRINYITYKDKRNGWNNPTCMVVYNNKQYKLRKTICYNINSIRLSCNICPYTKTERKSDITIGDYWGIEKQHPEFYSEYGNSLVLIHSKKGLELFSQIESKIDFLESSVDKCLQPNLIRPTARSKNRKRFWNDYNKLPYCFFMIKCMINKFLRDKKAKLKKMMNLQRRNEKETFIAK